MHHRPLIAVCNNKEGAGKVTVVINGEWCDNVGPLQLSGLSRRHRSTTVHILLPLLSALLVLSLSEIIGTGFTPSKPLLVAIRL